MRAWAGTDIQQERADQISFYTPDIIFLSEHVDVGQAIRVKFITGHSTKALTKCEVISKMAVPTVRSFALLGLREGEGAAEFILMPQRSIQKIESLMRRHVAQNGRKKHPWSQNQPVQIEITRESERTWSFKFVEMEMVEFRANFRYLAGIYRMLTFRGWFDLAVEHSDRLDFKNKPHRFNTEDRMEEKKTVSEEKKEENVAAQPTVIKEEKPLPKDLGAALRQMGYTSKPATDLCSELAKYSFASTRPGCEAAQPQPQYEPTVRKVVPVTAEDIDPPPSDQESALSLVKWLEEWAYAPIKQKIDRATATKVYARAGLPLNEDVVDDNLQPKDDKKRPTSPNKSV